MQAEVRKQYLHLDGIPIVGHTLRVFDRWPGLERLVLVVPADDLERCRADVLAPLRLRHVVRLVAGGRRRQDSVRRGLAAAGDGGGTVLIHDAVRPFVRPALIAACLDGVGATGACIPTLRATDTLKQVDDRGMVVATLDRRSIHRAQTPQTFSLELIRHAHRLADEQGFVATDDASVAAFAGARVVVVPGDADNIKITTPTDLFLARAILDRWRREHRR